MTLEKTIIFAFESKKILSSVLGVVNETKKIKYIVASRIPDVISILKTIQPSLIIFGFYNNQEAVSTLSGLSKYPKIPLLCLKDEKEHLKWGRESIVFTLSFYTSLQENVLSAHINSILMLSDSSNSASITNSLIDASMRKSFVNQGDELSKYVMELEKKKSVLLNMKKRIKELYNDASPTSKSKLLSLMNMIKNETLKEKPDEDFGVYFNRIRPMFLKRLLSKHPRLTPMDIKYCCYLCLNMSNNEIRNLLGINQESVRTHQYRLKKKMSLPRKLSLREYLNTLALQKAI